MSQEAALDHCFEPREEYPREYKPPGVEIRVEDLTEWTAADAIVQQCNCIAVRCNGLSVRLAEKYWWADVYRLRRPVRNRNLAVPEDRAKPCLLYTSPSPRDLSTSRMPSSA